MEDERLRDGGGMSFRTGKNGWDDPMCSCSQMYAKMGVGARDALDDPTFYTAPQLHV